MSIPRAAIRPLIESNAFGTYLKEKTMRVIVILKATSNSEAGVMPTSEDIEAGIRFNEEMVKAGILKSADGIKPSSFGKRVTLRRNRKPSITDGPFAETKELIAGYWIWEVKSMDEALEWAKRSPAPSSGEESIVEIRPFFGPEDFGEEFTQEMQERVETMHKVEEAERNK